MKRLLVVYSTLFIAIPIFGALLVFGLAGQAVAWAQEPPQCTLGGVPQCESIFLADSQEPGSVLVFPLFITGSFFEPTGLETPTTIVHARTEFEISVVCPKGATCPLNQEVRLRGHWVCPGTDVEVGGADNFCREVNFDLFPTVNGTVYFNPEGVFVVAGAAPIAVNPNNVETTILTPPCSKGYLIVWVVDGMGRAIKFDGLIGNAVIRDNFFVPFLDLTTTPDTLNITARNSARGYNAIPIQARSAPFPFVGGTVLETGDLTDLDGDGKLDFAFSDDPARGGPQEYKAPTGKIYGTVQYEDRVLPGTSDTYLTLLTLDVVSNRSNEPTFVGLNFYTADEVIASTGTAFACWRRNRLRNINEDLIQAKMGRKGLVESSYAEQRPLGGPPVPVTLLGLIETEEFITFDRLQEVVPAVGMVPAVNVNLRISEVRDYAYSLYNDSKPVATTFEPASQPVP